jgi:2-iminobutanoate/2-iminopropanoate deaminase
MSVTPRAIQTDQAPAAIGPYSQAVAAGGLVFVSGQIPLDPATGQLVTGGVAAQAAQAIANLRAILEAAGLSLDDVVKTTVLLADMADFEAVNKVYADHFTAEPRPARAAFQAAALPKGALVEIEAVAVTPPPRS